MNNTASEQQSWLATITFAFVAMYTHMSLGISIATLQSLIYFVVGLVLCRVLLDFPAQLIQRAIFRKHTEGLTGEPYNQGADKAAAVGTFLKAAQVIIAFAAAKFSHPYFF